MKRIVYIGKFQPFHKGHKQVIKELSEEYDEVVIVIGGAEKSFDTKYVFTAGERVEMIQQTVGQKADYIIPVPDINNNAVWTQHINQYTPEYNYICSNNPLVLRLYKNTTKQIRTINMKNRDKLSGTKIRNKMLNNQKWRDLVPDETVKIIEKYNGIDRIRELSNKDKDYSD